MLAKALSAENIVRRAEVAELGYFKIDLQPDEIFAGLDNPIFAQSHFDEVAEVPPGCLSIAANAGRPVQGFRLLEKKVWGLQFHPEFDYTFAEQLFTEVFCHFPDLKELYKKLEGNPEHLTQNRLIYQNFMKG